MLDFDTIRADFPILQEKINGQKLIYLDNAASTQKPKAMIDRLQQYYAKEYANIHRSAHTLSQLGTTAYEAVRGQVQQLLNAKDSSEIIFTKGTTESINLVANSFGELLQAGDEIIVSAMEHHANLVPWQLLCARKKTVLRILPINEKGELVFSELATLLNSRTKLLAITQLSNVLGTINPVAEIIAKAHTVGAKVLVDGAQSIVHGSVDVQAMDADFFVFSAHKLYGPTGVGVLYAKKALLAAMPPYQSGGAMIEKVGLLSSTFSAPPSKFEAGTPNIADVIAFGATLTYLQTLPWLALQVHEAELLQFLRVQLLQIPNLRLIGQAANTASLVSFVVEGVHAYDIATLLDQMGIAVRSGHHCAQPLMDFYQLAGTVRVSLGVYNTMQEMELFLQALKKVLRMLG